MDKKDICYVIMPFSDPEGYEAGHFSRVYLDLLRPAIEAAGYSPKRADDDKDSSLIHLGMVKDLIEIPMAICDLSSANPNVLFELGFRQAFDMPTVIVQEEGTRTIFDIDAIRRLEYKSSLKYHDVVRFHTTLKEALLATKQTADDQTGMNSIVRLLGAAKAQINEDTLLDANQVMEIIKASEKRTARQIKELANSLRRHTDYEDRGGLQSLSGHDYKRMIVIRTRYRRALAERDLSHEFLKELIATAYELPRTVEVRQLLSEMENTLSVLGPQDSPDNESSEPF